MSDKKKLCVIHLLTSGEIGGIEILCRDIAQYSNCHNRYCFMFHGGSIYEDMKNRGFDVHNLELLGGYFNLCRVKKMFALIKDADIIVVHHGDPFLRLFYFICKVVSRKKGVSFVHSCYEGAKYNNYGKCKQYIRDCIFQLAFWVSDAVVFVSNAGMITYESRFQFRKGQKFVVYNGISQTKIENGQKNMLSNKKTYEILYVGRLNKIKGIDILIKSISKIRSNTQIHLSIVGDGGIRSELEKLCCDLAINDIVTFYGKQMDVECFFSKAQIFVYPSMWQEVFGISIVEAMSYGLLCVANSVGGIPEIIKNDKNGYLTAEISEDALADCIMRAIRAFEDNQYIEISKNAKETAALFSIDKTVGELEKVYQEIS